MAASEDMLESPPSEVANRLFDAISAGDIDAVRSLYAPDARIWHNYDGREQAVDENLRTLAWLAQTFTDIRYEDIRRHLTPGGFAQQHVFRATSRSGEQIAIPAAIFARVEHGQITRIDEYLEPSPLAGFIRRRP